MSKQIARKASTPRLEEENPPPKETKQELVKKCFGFDTDSAESDTSIGNTTRDSLVGFSPVRSAQPNIHVQITPAFTKTCDKTKVKSSIVQPRSRMQVAPPDKPMRFDVGQFKRPKTTTEHSSYSRSR